MSSKLQARLKKLPKGSGVYFFKNAKAEIIYIGKAANLRNRVRSYFQAGRPQDTKTTLLIENIATLDWQEVPTEADALFLEAELVRRYMPDYNILLRDDKSNQYVRIDYSSSYPTVTLVRRPLDDGARYFGPFVNGLALKKSLRYLRRAFPYATGKSSARRPSLHYHLGLDPGLEDKRTSLNDYRANLRKLMRYLRGNRLALTRQLEKEMKTSASEREFEKAAVIRNQLRALNDLGRQTLLSSVEAAEESRDFALAEITQLLQLKQLLRRIEGFDISHIQGSDNVASMVVFTLGLPDKAAYRKFKLRLPGNDDFAHMNEAVSRRLSPTNFKKWGVPQLILIDGGKGQLSAALRARDELGHTDLPTVGLAKAEEKIIIHNDSSFPGANLEKIIEQARRLNAYVEVSDGFTMIQLPPASHAIKLLQRIRDESHRFALSYHGSLRQRRSTASMLEALPGIGPVTRKQLIRSFGSMSGAQAADAKSLLELFGPKRGQIIYERLQSIK